MAIYEPPDDSAYLGWLAANPNGYVINAEPGWRGYVLLHCATCTHIRNRPPFIGPTYNKYCRPWPPETPRYSLAGRAERVGATKHPLVARAGPEIFGDRDQRYDELVSVIVNAAGRMRGPSAAGCDDHGG